MPPHLMDSYWELVRELSDRFYSQVTRYTSSAFLRLKLGRTLAAHEVKPIFSRRAKRCSAS